MPLSGVSHRVVRLLRLSESSKTKNVLECLESLYGEPNKLFGISFCIGTNIAKPCNGLAKAWIV